MWVFSVVSCRYTIDDLVLSELYIVDLSVSICFESNGPCLLTRDILSGAILPKPLCQWKSANLINGKTSSM